MSVKPIPDGYHSVTPYLIVNDGAAAIEYYKRAFGATVVVHMPMPDGRLGHAELQIGDSRIMMADENEAVGARSAKHYGGTPIAILLYVPDVDGMVKDAVAAGGKITREIADQFHGDRVGVIEDPFGLTWYIHTHIKDVTPEEMKQGVGG